jgi:hypothetical protein
LFLALVKSCHTEKQAYYRGVLGLILSRQRKLKNNITERSKMVTGTQPQTF